MTKEERAPWPRRLEIDRQAGSLTIAFDDGTEAVLPAEYLRVESPSAEVQGHGPSQKKIVAGKRRVTLVGAEPVGHYAVRLFFDDGHDSGLFSWRYLYTLAREQESRWQAYLDALAAQGLSRDTA